MQVWDSASGEQAFARDAGKGGGAIFALAYSPDGLQVRFRGGLVFKAHRLLSHSTLGLRVIKKKKHSVRERLAPRH